MILKSKIFPMACFPPVFRSFIFIDIGLLIVSQVQQKETDTFQYKLQILYLCANTLLLNLALLLKWADKNIWWQFIYLFLLVRSTYTEPSLLCISSLVVQLLCYASLALYMRICIITSLIPPIHLLPLLPPLPPPPTNK